ncbi:hypothetical protein POM88_026034 [Heracleum sosnowskyi]|uniref:DUF7915 domain-containing protein n=1 Tax=Heracleum sosnowskyi TaxID=360622 RepID=A0AAD8MKA9_9APIA|nr:hypothetical protein POM88_026034 [Heracleum sosnowskyi]
MGKTEEEVCPTEDIFMALLNALLHPYFSETPSQQLLANQMHAVVLLYNYFHRKRHPTLDYLDFISCCELAVIFNPMLLPYMNLMRQPHYNALLDLNNHQLSLTEQLIMNAYALLQLAFSGIKQIAGIDNTDLEVLESHTAYSLNEEKTAAHFLIVQSSQSITEDHQVHVKDVIESLQGPLVRKSSCGWMLTTVHQYFHLLPYTGILSDWFSREQLLKHLRVKVQDTASQCLNSTENHQKNAVVVDENVTHENHCVTDAVINEASNGSHDPTKQELNDGCSHHIFVPEKVVRDEFYKDASSNFKVSHPIRETTAMEIDKDVLPTDIILLENDIECSNSIIQQDTVDVDIFGSVNINHPIMKIDSMEIDKYVSPNDINLVAPKTNSVTGITSKVFKEVESKSSRISSSSGDSEASGNHAFDSHQLNSIKVEKPTSNLALDEDALQQATLKPLLEKREKLSVQRSSIEEELALCEKHIQTFTNGDAHDIEVKMQAVIEFCDYISTNSTTESQDGPGLGPCQHLEDPVTLHAKRKRSPVAILPIHHHCCPEICKELDIFCCMNKWMLPTYCVRSSHDGFHADVKVKGVNLALSERSDLKTTPAEARASAAVKMMDLLDRVLPKQ